MRRSPGLEPGQGSGYERQAFAGLQVPHLRTVSAGRFRERLAGRRLTPSPQVVVDHVPRRAVDEGGEFLGVAQTTGAHVLL